MTYAPSQQPLPPIRIPQRGTSDTNTGSNESTPPTQMLLPGCIENPVSEGHESSQSSAAGSQSPRSADKLWDTNRGLAGRAKPFGTEKENSCAVDEQDATNQEKRSMPACESLYARMPASDESGWMGPPEKSSPIGPKWGELHDPSGDVESGWKSGDGNFKLRAVSCEGGYSPKRACSDDHSVSRGSKMRKHKHDLTGKIGPPGIGHHHHQHHHHDHHHHDHQHQDDNEDVDDWESNAENAYGAFIHVALQFGLFEAFTKCGPMLTASVLIQFAFSYELFLALPPLEEDSKFCDIPWDLQLSAIAVFVTLMLNNVPGMLNACAISLGSKDYHLEETGKLQLKRSTIYRIVTWTFAVLTELATWSGILVSGVFFILTSPSVDLVIRSTVAIIFVQNVDEIVFESCCSREIKESMNKTTWKTHHPLTLLGFSEEKAMRIESSYSLFLHLPVVACISGVIVFGARSLPGVDCLHSSL